ncbi:MAG: hypothetical protein FWE24_10700 [Defluviitaleaceae bacterium]|nr:hypothetical protein [Defluviitaleaceae bacterium]
MSAFELNEHANSMFGGPNPSARHHGNANAPNHVHKPDANAHPGIPKPIKTKIENIIAFKIYDICRQQDCLDFDDIGPARAAEETALGQEIICEGDIIIPPHDAASVSLEDLHIKRIVIVDKRPSCFRKGYWDVELKYVMGYRLVFRGADARIKHDVKAFSIFNRKVTLFGSEGCDLFVSTDLFGKDGMFEAMPFIMAEGKAMALSASIIYDHCRPCHGCDDHEIGGSGGADGRRRAKGVEVVIGLFSIVKLFRLVDLAVESTGFTIPEECEDICPLDPCEFFDGLEFPMDLFAPPQKPEFHAGISSNIPSSRVRNREHIILDEEA